MSTNALLNVVDLDSVETGDLLLFAGNNFIARAIEYFTSSPYSHIGIILKDPVWLDPAFRGLYFIESTSPTTPDSEDKQLKLGVQIHKLDDVLSTCGGRVVYRSLHCKRDDQFFERLKEAHATVHNKPYNLKIKDWIYAKYLVDCNDEDKIESMFALEKKTYQDTSTFWCSALTAYLYDRLGLFEPDPNLCWTLLAPCHFAEAAKDTIYRFKQGVHLGPEITVKKADALFWLF